MSEIVKLEAGQYLLREGDESAEMYYLQEGSLAVLKVKGGAEQQIGTIYKGEVVGEMSFLDQAPRSAAIRAISDSELTVIPREKFEKVMSTMPVWYNALIQTLLDRLRKANSRIKV